jgi:hypothetical protein
MGFFQAEGSAAWFRGCIVLGRAGRPGFQGSERRNLRIPSGKPQRAGKPGTRPECALEPPPPLFGGVHGGEALGQADGSNPGATRSRLRWLST